MALPVLNAAKYKTVIPSQNKEIEYRPYLVKEEKILMVALESKDSNQILGALKDVIVSEEDKFWEVIDELKAAGAEGILVIPIDKIVL